MYSKGHTLSQQQRDSIIKANKNRVWTEEMRRKKEYLRNVLNMSKLRKPICKYSLDGQLIEEFPSVMDAARTLGNPNTTRVSIKRCYQGKQKSAYGYIWKLKIHK